MKEGTICHLQASMQAQCLTTLLNTIRTMETTEISPISSRGLYSTFRWRSIQAEMGSRKSRQGGTLRWVVLTALGLTSLVALTQLMEVLATSSSQTLLHRWAPVSLLRCTTLSFLDLTWVVYPREEASPLLTSDKESTSILNRPTTPRLLDFSTTPV
jgi:hypothetical protein